MPQIAVIALSRQGAALAGRLSDSLGDDASLYLDRRFADLPIGGPRPKATVFDLPVRPVLRQVWDEFEAVVLFLPVGAAVRLVAPLLQDKRRDPALVCVDDGGRFAVSVASGHIGGADSLAQRVAAVLGAEAVITSGSHATGTLAVDLLGRELGWTIEADSNSITRASAAVVNRDPVGVFQDAGETDWWHSGAGLPDNITVFSSLEALGRSRCSAALLISDRADPFRESGKIAEEVMRDVHLVIYRPRTLVAGMGCRRGVPMEELERHLSETFCTNNLSLKSLSCIATATLKQDEAGLQELAEKYGVPLVPFGPDELNGVFDNPERDLQASAESEDICGSGAAGSDAGTERRFLHPSENARRLVGVWGVAEPAALLASGAARLVVTKRTAARCTAAVARISHLIRNEPQA